MPLSTKQVGDQAETLALQHLLAAGLRLVARNYRAPVRHAGEVDLILSEPNGTLVFVEVRRRAQADYGGALASVGLAKRRRLIAAARHYLLRLSRLPPCRFDVVALQGGHIEWIRGAFDVGSDG